MQQIVQMKIEQLIVQFLHKNKKVKLQSIGEFVFLSDSSVSEETDIFFPEDSIKFIFDTKCSADDELISYIMSQTGKIRPLAASDLDSYIVLSKQFLNIGKTLFLNGLGALQKNQNNEYEFKQGEAIPVKLDTPNLKSERNQIDPVISFASPVRKKSHKKYILPVAVTIAVLLIIITSYYLISNSKNANTNVAIPNIDSTAYYDSLDALSFKNDPVSNQKLNKHSQNSDSTNALNVDSIIDKPHTDSNPLIDTNKVHP